MSKFEISSEANFKRNELVTFNYDLTKNSSEHIDDIIKAVFASINVSKTDDNIEFIINNLKSIKEIKSKNKEDEKPAVLDDIDTILINDYYFEEENLLGSRLHTLFCRKVRNLLSNLAPNNSFILVDSNNEIKTKYLDNKNFENIYKRAYNAPYKVYNFSNEDRLIRRNWKFYL